MAELFSPTWLIQRYEILNLDKFCSSNFWDKDFKDNIKITLAEEFKGSASEAAQRAKELLQTEPNSLRYSLPRPKVEYHYKLKH